MQKNRKNLILYLIITIAVLLFFSVRTSPIYSLKLGDYGNNDAATGMLIGKYWLEGVIPYKDLFALGGPLYFLIQAVGWGIAGRTGIFVCQIISYFIFLVFMRKALLHFCSGKAANIVGVLSVLVYIALCSGGDSTAEWCLSLTAVQFYLALRESEDEKKNRMNFVLSGVLCAGVFFIDPLSGGMIYGLTVFRAPDIFGRDRRKSRSGYVLSFILGAAIVCLPVLVYFAVYGCLNDMFRAMLLYPLKGMVMESERAVLIHKMAKCILVLPLLGAGVYCFLKSDRNIRKADGAAIWKKEKRSGTRIVLCAVFQILFLMLCRNDWYAYLITIPGIMIAVAVFISAEGKSRKVLLTAGTMLITAGICFSPLKNYGFYMTDGVPDVVEEFLADLESFQTENEECRMLFLDSDSTWYLLTNQKPDYRYFTDQTDLASWDVEIAGEKERYLSRKNDVIISTEHGWHGQDFDNYTLIQVYLKTRGNICIYVPY